MLEKKIVIQLLHIINSDGDIKKLRHSGLTYRQIAELIDANVTNGNLDGNDDIVTITQQGKDLLQVNKGEIKERDKSKWIEIDFKNKMQQIDKEDVFLPRKNDMSFLK
ncbi:hypothetical protein [Pedobacter panaciterrae]